MIKTQPPHSKRIISRSRKNIAGPQKISQPLLTKYFYPTPGKNFIFGKKPQSLNKSQTLPSKILVLVKNFTFLEKFSHVHPQKKLIPLKKINIGPPPPGKKINLIENSQTPLA